MKQKLRYMHHPNRTAMKPLLLAIALMATVTACHNKSDHLSNPPNHNKMEHPTEKAAIETLLYAYRDALNASDAQKVLSLYTTDGVFMPSNAPSAVGTQAVKASYDFVFKTIQLHIAFYIDEIIIDGTHAYARTTSKGTTRIHASGETLPEENRELFVLQKVNGQWKIARYMFNKMK